MYYLFPKIHRAYAEKLIEERSKLDIAQLLKLSDVTHYLAFYSPTGGNRIPSDILVKLQKSIRKCAEDYGYPQPVSDEISRKFDIRCGIICFEEMHLHPSEASDIEVWAFMTCILLPDVVRWRFPGDATAAERFIGSDRGLRRNTFGRLWWRSYLLKQPHLMDPYYFISSLYEDDLVQITERNSIAASPTLMAQFCLEFLNAVKNYPNIPRRTLIREATKRVRRLISIINFDAIDDTALPTSITQIFAKTVESIEHQKAAKNSAMSV